MLRIFYPFFLLATLALPVFAAEDFGSGINTVQEIHSECETQFVKELSDKKAPSPSKLFEKKANCILSGIRSQANKGSPISQLSMMLELKTYARAGVLAKQKAWAEINYWKSQILENPNSNMEIKFLAKSVGGY